MEEILETIPNVCEVNFRNRKEVIHVQLITIPPHYIIVGGECLCFTPIA